MRTPAPLHLHKQHPGQGGTDPASPVGAKQLHQGNRAGGNPQTCQNQPLPLGAATPIGPRRALNRIQHDQRRRGRELLCISCSNKSSASINSAIPIRHKLQPRSASPWISTVRAACRCCDQVNRIGDKQALVQSGPRPGRPRLELQVEILTCNRSGRDCYNKKRSCRYLQAICWRQLCHQESN